MAAAGMAPETLAVEAEAVEEPAGELAPVVAPVPPLLEVVAAAPLPPEPEVEAAAEAAAVGTAAGSWTNC